MANYKVTAYSLNVRSGPSLQYSVIDVLRKDQVVVGGSTQTDPDLATRTWLEIDLPAGAKGWSSMKYFSLTTDPADKNEYQVIASSLNVRSTPDLDGDIVGVLIREDKVPVGKRSTDGRWMEINTPTLSGWSYLKYLRPDIPSSADPAWITIALGEMGIKEISGAGDNPRIVEYHRTTTYPLPSNYRDEVPWCSSFVNWCMEQAGHEGTDHAGARSWKNWGKSIATSPKRGAIVVIQRVGESPGTIQHVGFYYGDSGSDIFLLGGNQSNSVNITKYNKSRAFDYRWPS